MFQQHDDALWSITDSLRFLGVRFPIRMSVVRLPRGGLWLWSPVPIDDVRAAALAELGEVGAIVAPNRYHHVHAGPAKARYPSALFYGAPGLREKRRDLSFDAELGESPPAEWEGAFEQVVLRGAPEFNEVVFFHRASGTLFAADLFLNIESTTGWFDQMYFRIEGTYRRFAVPRLLHLLTRDRARMRADLAQVASWPIRRVVVSHGAIVETDGQEKVRAALARFVGTKVLATPAQT